MVGWEYTRTYVVMSSYDCNNSCYLNTNLVYYAALRLLVLIQNEKHKVLIYVDLQIYAIKYIYFFF